mgnify:CR=1 FL=1
MVGLQDLAAGSRKGEEQEGPDLCELRRISVHPSERCGKLVCAFLEQARRGGFSGVKLYTGSWMVEATRRLSDHYCEVNCFAKFKIVLYCFV